MRHFPNLGQKLDSEKCAGDLCPSLLYNVIKSLSVAWKWVRVIWPLVRVVPTRTIVKTED